MSISSNKEKFDTSTRLNARNLNLKMESADFIISLMFMRNIMQKTMQMTAVLQAEELNILDAVEIIKVTIASLKKINEDEAGMNAQIQAGILFARKQGGEPEAEFAKKHRIRRRPIRTDEHPETEVDVQMVQFFRKEFKSVLDTQINELDDNLVQCLKAVEPLARVLLPPFKEPVLDDINELIHLFPCTTSMDPYALQAEIASLFEHIKLKGLKLKSIDETARYTEKWKAVFPLSNKAFRLLLTAPVTVAADERAFSRLKLVKTYLRASMTDNRLESLLLLSCEKDLTDSIDLDCIAKRWAELKSRRVKIN